MMETILNRWRGTGGIFFPFGFKITGTMIYAVYVGILFGFLTTWYIGLLSIGLFLLGESSGWGKWLGSLTYPENVTEAVKNERKDTLAHKIANFFIPQDKNYFWYCNLALGLRGLYWGALVYLGLIAGGYIANAFIFVLNLLPYVDVGYVTNVIYISLIEYLSLALIWAIGFPLSAYLGRKFTFKFSYKYLDSADKWGSAELYYGFTHFICNMYIVWSIYV